MRMMMKVSIPNEQGNKAASSGALPETLLTFIEQHRPEAAYFVAQDGVRTGYFFLDVEDTTSLPSIAEPFFMKLGAYVELTPAMTPSEMKEGVERAMKSNR